MATPDFIKAPIALLNNMVLPHPRAPRVSMAGKRVLVTGATPGSIGYITATTLQQWGAELTVTVRSEASRERLLSQLQQDCPGHNIEVMLLDLGDQQSVKRFHTSFSRQYDSLDILLNNAGVYLDMLGEWKSEKLTGDGEEIHWRINYLGVVQLSNALAPLLRNASANRGEARLIMLVSHMHDNCANDEMFEGLSPYKSVKAYGRSKLGLMHFNQLMHQEYSGDTGIKFVSVHPGSIQTNLVEKGLAGSPRLLALRNKLAWLEAMLLLTPEQGAQTQIMCASSPDIDSGAYYRRCAADKPADSLEDQQASRRLWEETRLWLEDQGEKVHL